MINQETIESNKTVWDENAYYDMAEYAIEKQWTNLIWPEIKDCDFELVIDLAAGHGRNTVKLLEVSGNIAIVDFSENNIKHCQERFIDNSNISYHLCDGQSIPLWNDTYTLVYCFDAMVHFEPEIVYNYLYEAYRVLKPQGKAFFHHSNYDTANIHWRKNPHARNYMTQNLFLYWSKRIGFKIISSKVINWGKSENLDCITVLEK